MTRTIHLLCVLGGALIALLMLTFPAAAWHRTIHDTICRAAWAQLHATPRLRIQDLLNLGPTTAESDFAALCAWADDIVAERPDTAAWHVLAIPPDARAIDMARDCPAPTSCIVAQIEQHMEVLKSGASRAERADSLKFLIHLVGDIHQPLHIGFTKDRHGRDIPVTFMDRETTLYAVWNHELIAAPAPPPNDAFKSLFANIDAVYNRERWTGATVRDWAQETLWLMRTPSTGYLGNPGGVVLDDAYLAQNHPIAREQIDKAGIRLAEVLNAIFE